MNRVNSLTSLRFFAAFGVLLFHFRLTLPGKLGELFKVISSNGFTGVTFFFILSGFLLATIYSEKTLDTKPDRRKFYLKRLIRIVPTYWFVLLVSLFFVRGQLHVAKTQGVFPQRLGDVFLHIGLLQTWVEGSSLRLHWNEPSWSVSVEMFYYLLFPLLLVLAIKCKESVVLPIIGLASSAILHGLVFSVRPGSWTNIAPGTARDIFWSPPTYLPVFAFGMFGAMLTKELIRRNVDATLWKISFWMGAVFIIAFAIMGQESNPYAQMMLCVGMTIFVAGASQGRGAIDRFLSLPALLVLGEASYALYLVQRPTDEWLRFVWKNPSSMNLFNMVVIGVSILASLAIWYWFERPIGKWLTQKFVRS